MPTGVYERTRVPGPGNYKAVSAGYRSKAHVKVHRLRAAAALGRPLPASAHVHHVDRDIWNASARLVICENAKYHDLLEVRTRIVRAGGDPDKQQFCTGCDALRPVTDFHRCADRVSGFQKSCKSCQLTWARARRERGKAA